MGTNYSDQSSDEPNSKRRKTEPNTSTSSKSEVSDDCPILILPPDILAKIIAYVPVAQWPALELLYDFRLATLIAWRHLRNLNVEREFLIQPDGLEDSSSFIKRIVSILQKLVERSPFLTSIDGIPLVDDGALNSDAIQSLAQFQHLQSMTIGDAKKFFSDAKKFFNVERGIPLANVVAFLESTLSRTNLKEIRLFRIVQGQFDYGTVFDRFATSFVHGLEIESPLRLEKFSFASSDRCIFTRLDTIDTTRLTELRVENASIEPEQLTNLIERASNLRLIEISFLHCRRNCNGQRLEANKKLLAALASHEYLTAIRFKGRVFNQNCKCTDFGPEVIEMLRAIGRRGQLRKLALEHSFVQSSTTIDTNEICATIRDYIPYLHSIKLHIDDANNGIASDILSLTELREIHLTNCWRTSGMTTSAIKKIGQLSKLKRLALNGFDDVDNNSLKCLANATTLSHLRFSEANWISADVYVKWSEGFAPNLEILMLRGIAVEEVDAEEGLVRLLEKATRVRVLLLQGYITDKSLKAIANSGLELEVLCVRSSSNDEITVQCLQDIVDRCQKLKRLGGIEYDKRKELHIQKYRKIDDVDTWFWDSDFDDAMYN